MWPILDKYLPSIDWPEGDEPGKDKDGVIHEEAIMNDKEILDMQISLYRPNFFLTSLAIDLSRYLADPSGDKAIDEKNIPVLKKRLSLVNGSYHFWLKPLAH